MGACSFENRGKGKSAQDVFRRLQERAEREYGDDCYNGTISTVPGFRDVTNEWKSSKKNLDQFISDKIEDGNKYDCFCICVRPPVANTNKTKTQVEHIVEKGTKKWELKYVVQTYDGIISSHATKGDAVKAARVYTEKYLSTSTVHMKKVLAKGKTEVAKITYKASSTEKDGEYIFFGWAAE